MHRASRFRLILLCLAGLAGSTGMSVAAPPPVGRLVSYQDLTGVYLPRSTISVSPRLGLPLTPGEDLQTNDRGLAETLFESGWQVKMDRSTRVQILNSRSQPMSVLHGRVWMKGLGFFGIKTPAADARAHGTEFEVQVMDDASHTTILKVWEGTVTFSNSQGPRLVPQGYYSTARPGERPAPPQPLTAADLRDVIQWTDDVQPVDLVLEISFVDQNPAHLPAEMTRAMAMPEGWPKDLRLGDIYHDMGAFDDQHHPQALLDAQDAYEKALGALGPGTQKQKAIVEQRLGQTWLELGNAPVAEGWFKRSLGDDPASTPARVGLVMTLLSEGGPSDEVLAKAKDEALAEAERAVAGDPHSPVARTAHALALIQAHAVLPTALSADQGQTPDQEAQAQRHREEALQYRAEALAELDQALQLDPRYAQALAWKSFLLRTAERLKEALAVAEQAVGAAPFSALAHQVRSDAWFACGEVGKARADAQAAVALDPLSPGAHASLARVLLQEGKAEAAVTEASKAVALGPKLDRAHFIFGLALWEGRRLGPAAEQLQQALALDPGYLEASAYLARVYLERGEKKPAMAVAEAALRSAETVNPGLDAAQNPRLAPVLAALGRVYWRAGRLKDAAARLEQALALAPGSVLYELDLARVDLDRNDLPDALKQALAAVAAVPGSSEAHAVLGLVYDRQDNQDQAAREYQEALSLSPEDSLARLGLSMTAFTGSSRALPGSGRDREREQAQALLRDPAVLQEIFKPGVTTELLGGGGGDSHEEQHLLHRGQFALGQVNDLSLASRFSDEGYRPNSSTDGRLLQSNVAVQATPETQLLVQVQSDKNGGGLPGPKDTPDLRAYYSRRENDYLLYARRDLGGGTHLWLRYGVQAVRETRNDPDAMPQTVMFPPVPQVFFGDELPALLLYNIRQRGDERGTELRLDHQAGRHGLTYGLALLDFDALAPDQRYRQPDSAPMGGGSGAPALEIRSSSFDRDFLQYVQDDYHIGGRGSLIVGTQLLRLRDHDSLDLRVAPSLGAVPPVIKPTQRKGHHVLPYLALTYHLDARNLVRILGNRTLLRRATPLLAPSEAFIVGEPVSVYFTTGDTTGGAETYELDYERRLSGSTFVKLFLQSSLAANFDISPSLTQSVIPLGVQVPQARLRVAGLRLEHQISRYLSGFTRWSYSEVVDHTPARSSYGLEIPFAPRWVGLTGLNYVDRAGSKALLTASFLGRRFTDVGLPSDAAGFGGPDYIPTAHRPATGPHMLVDLRIAKEPSVRMEYSLTVTNLFATSYPDVFPGFPTRGRTWLITLARRF